MGSSRSAYRGGPRRRSRLCLGILDISYRNKNIPRTSDYWSLARPMFFASSPGLVFLLMSVPASFVADIVRAVGVAWIAISTVIAVKTALGVDSQRSILTFILVAFIVLIGYGLLSSL